VKIKNRHRLKAKDIKQLQDELKRTFTIDFFNERSSVEKGEFDNQTIILIDGEPCFMFYENKIIFTLHGLEKFKPKQNFVVVDMGAVRFVTNGADVMAPGIVDADLKIVENDQVWICDEIHRKPLAIGIANMTGEQMRNEKKGKAIKTVHFVGDNLWKSCYSL
jgi:PUA domain protein